MRTPLHGKQEASVAERALARILEETRGLDMLTALGLPVRYNNKLYNCAAVIQEGKILGLVPKTYIPSYGEFYEGRWFASGKGLDTSVTLCEQYRELCHSMIFSCEAVPALAVGDRVAITAAAVQETEPARLTGVTEITPAE